MGGQGDEEVTGLLVSNRRLVNGAEWADEDLGFTLATDEQFAKILDSTAVY